MESESICDFLSLSASAASGEDARDNDQISKSVLPTAAATEVSPGGEGVTHPSNSRNNDDDIVNNDNNHQKLQEEGEDADDGDVVGFGPPPAFPNSNSKLHAGKRKRTLIAVSSTPAVAGDATSATCTLLDDVSSDEEEIEEGRLGRRGYNNSSGNSMKSKQSQMIHRIKSSTEGPLPSSSTHNHSHGDKTREDADEDDGAKSYIDAMLLASLSDVDSSPKRLEEFANSASFSDKKPSPNLSIHAPQESLFTRETNSSSQATMMDISTDSPKATIHIGTSATAPTPLRSNVNLVKPYALMPKPNKRGKFVSSVVDSSSSSSSSNNTTEASSAPHPPAHWPDVREPRADKLSKTERGATREGIVNAGLHSTPPTPQPLPLTTSTSQYPMGYPPHPYHYPPQDSAAAAGYATYPPPPTRGPPSTIPYAHIPQGLQYGASPHHHAPARPYYPGSGPPVVVGSPDRWDQYPPSSTTTTTTTSTTLPDPNKHTAAAAAAGWTPESVRSTSSTRTSRNKSHVVPSEDGEQQPVGSSAVGGEGVVHRPYHGTVVGPPPPPPPGYPYAMYHDPSTMDGYYPAGPPPPHEYKTISGDDGSPPRTTALPSSHHPHHHGGGPVGHYGDYYSSAVNTPPRGGGAGHFEYYHDQSPQHAVPVVPGSHHGGYPPPPPPPPQILPREGYHPDSPMTSMYPHHNAHPLPPYGAGPPPSQFSHPHDSYDPSYYHVMNSPSSFAKDGHHQHSHHDDVSAVVSSETEGNGGGSGGSVVMVTKNHQFRKGGRSIHSAPIILRKKFSWRNYAELEEYLIANRAEYLRHSALNYSAEQKHFNNQLTEGLLELAAKLNYVFDETCFNFVTVRDRIRCYYKSYVQSSKKRGVVMGYSNKAHHRGDGCSE